MEAKVQVLRETFFPKPLAADLSDIGISRPPPEPIDFPLITEHEVRRAIRQAPAEKAPGADGIPNKVWHMLTNDGADSSADFIDIITRIFNACVRIGHNPRHFQNSITVALWKDAPRDYRLPKSYRPVALLNTLGKILESIIAARISWAAEEHQLLPKTHLGGRKGISVDHAIQLILDRVHRAWGKGKKVSMMLLDVQGAYDNVSHKRLLSNIRQMRLGQLAPWIQSFLSGRSTRIRLPGHHLSQSFPTPTGIP